MEKGFTKREIAEKLGLSMRTVRFFVDRGVIVPGILNSGRRGKAAFYSKCNLLEIAVLGELFAFGIPVRIMGWALELMKERGIFSEVEAKRIIEQEIFVVISWGNFDDVDKRGKIRHFENISINYLAANELYKISGKSTRDYRSRNCLLLLDLKQIFGPLLRD